MMRRLPRKESPVGAPEGQNTAAKVVRRYEITVEREFLSVRDQAARGFNAHCPECGLTVPMLPPDLAAQAAGTTTRNVYCWVEQNRVHFVEPASGGLFICSASLRLLAGSNQIAPGGSD